jgi:hypothetical protein
LRPRGAFLEHLDGTTITRYPRSLGRSIAISNLSVAGGRACGFTVAGF